MPVDQLDEVDVISKKRKMWIICGVVAAVVVVAIAVVVAIVLTKDEDVDEQEKYVKSVCGKGNHDCRGAWFYRTTENSPEYNVEFAKSKNWNFVLMTANPKNEKNVDIINAFTDAGIHVHWMTLEDHTYVYRHDDAIVKINAVLDFIETHKLNVTGIHIDSEPHALDEWKNAADWTAKNAIFQQYVSLLEKVRAVLDKRAPHMLFSAAVAWWYSSKEKGGDLENGLGTNLVNSKRLDMVVPMIYDEAGPSSEAVITKMHENGYIGDGAATLVGMGVEEFASISDLDKNVQEVIDYAKSNSNCYEKFYGISIFANHKYPDWGQTV